MTCNMTVDETYTTIISNWNTIKDNTEIMNVLNIDTNSMCQYIKQTNPSLSDTMIQARALTLLLFMIIFVNDPIQNMIERVD